MEGEGDWVCEVDLVDVSGGDVVEGSVDLCDVVGFWGEVEFGWVDGPRGLVRGLGGGDLGAALGDDVGEAGLLCGYGLFDCGCEVVGEGEEPVVVGMVV